VLTVRGCDEPRDWRRPWRDRPGLLKVRDWREPRDWRRIWRDRAGLGRFWPCGCCSAPSSPSGYYQPCMDCGCPALPDLIHCAFSFTGCNTGGYVGTCPLTRNWSATAGGNPQNAFGMCRTYFTGQVRTFACTIYGGVTNVVIALACERSEGGVGAIDCGSGAPAPCRSSVYHWTCQISIVCVGTGFSNWVACKCLNANAAVCSPFSLSFSNFTTVATPFDCCGNCTTQSAIFTL